MTPACDNAAGHRATPAESLPEAREPQCAYVRVGATTHHRIPGCGMTWTRFQTGVASGEIVVLLEEPTDSERCAKCYSDASYQRHPL